MEMFVTRTRLLFLLAGLVVVVLIAMDLWMLR
jgi:hypothetical protein